MTGDYKDILHLTTSLLLEIENYLRVLPEGVDPHLIGDLKHLLYSDSQQDYSLTSLLSYLKRNIVLEQYVRDIQGKRIQG